jgi:hypothetical protein
VRKPKLSYETLPRDWLGGNLVLSQVANAVNLLFPAGERFFIRSVRHYLDRLSPEMAALVRDFFRQEGSHAAAHERFFSVMRAQGYEIDRFLARYERIAYGLVEKRLPPSLRLAITAALEHFTAILAEGALGRGTLASAHPEMQALLLWHAAEEIEHKSVAFDVLQQVAPGYPLRMAGLVVAVASLATLWGLATVMLLRQDRPGLLAVVRAHRDNRDVQSPLGLFVEGIWDYIRPGFHPSQRDNDALARDYLRTWTAAQEEGGHE